MLCVYIVTIMIILSSKKKSYTELNCSNLQTITHPDTTWFSKNKSVHFVSTIITMKDTCSTRSNTKQHY